VTGILLLLSLALPCVERSYIAVTTVISCPACSYRTVLCCRLSVWLFWFRVYHQVPEYFVRFKNST